MDRVSVQSEIAKAAPPIAVAAADKLFDLTLNEWVLIATLVYIGLQSVVLIYKTWIKPGRRRNE